MKEAECGQEKAARQCWECLRRRLVCDHTLPHCKKCQKAGKQCPGYDEQKPLQWVQPGKVTSRRRKRDSTLLICTAPSKEVAKCELRAVETSSASAPDATPIDTIFKSCQQFISAFKSITEHERENLAEDHDAELPQKLAIHNTSAAEIIDEIFSIGGKRRLEDAISRELQEEAAHIVESRSSSLKRHERILRIMQMYDLPDYGYLTDDTNQVVQAVNYFNVRMYPSLKAAGTLVPNAAIINFPLAALHLLPPAVHHTLVCLSMNHFLQSLPVDGDMAMVVMNRSKIYQHRGAAIRALSEYVGKDKTKCSDLSIVSILMFMSMELQNPAMADWRSHASGMMQLIEMRGGLRSLIEQSPYLVPSLVIYILIVTKGNTCSPSWNQLTLSGPPEDTVVCISNIYSLIFPYTLCPPDLFFSTHRISRLRGTASTVLFTGTVDPAHSLEAHDLLTAIEAFSPEDWAQPGGYYDEWLLIGTIYQSAVAIYCTMAFQSLTILPSTLEMNSMRDIHADRLLSGLKVAMKSPHLIHFMMWPLTVAGVEAGYRDEVTRYWLGKQLVELSRFMGSSSPLKAKAVLQRYWQKGKPGWDECFDRAYVFAI